MLKQITLFLLFLLATRESIGQTYVQGGWLWQSPSTSATVATAFPANSTSGDLIVVHLDWDNAADTVKKVVDNKGNIYKKINGTTLWNGGAYAAELWYTYNNRVLYSAYHKILLPNLSVLLFFLYPETRP